MMSGTPEEEVLIGRKAIDCIVCSNCQKISQFSNPNQNKLAQVKCWSCHHYTHISPPPKKPANQPPRSACSSGAKGTDANPIDLDYYNLLDVKPTASTAQIKKAYYLKAMKYHPDKCSDPGAEDIFKKISEAYQTLYDPQRRSHYNSYGKATQGNDNVFVDPEEFFKQQYGGDKFVDIIGEISIAKDFKEAMSMMNKDGTESKNTIEEKNGEERTNTRKTRIAVLASNLIEKLSIYTDHIPPPRRTTSLDVTVEEEEPSALDLHKQNFRRIITLEAQGLYEENYGPELLKAIGYTYELKATQCKSRLDSMDGTFFKRMWGFAGTYSGTVKEKAHIFNETVGTFRTALDLQTKFAKLQEMEKNKESSNDPNSENTHKKEEKETLSEETDIHHAELRARLESEAANKGLEALWRGSKLEVEGVLRDVCELVLKVASEDGKEEEGAFDRALVRDRAEGLKIIGEVYMEVGSSKPK